MHGHGHKTHLSNVMVQPEPRVLDNTMEGLSKWLHGYGCSDRGGMSEEANQRGGGGGWQQVHVNTRS